MRSPTLLLAALALALAPPLFAQSIRPGGPTDGGTRAVCDLPASQHMRNTGGADGPGGPGTGSGLCVYTSGEVAGARWQSAPLAGFQQWMTRHPGGGYPEKLEEMIVRFCRETKREIPRYVQHTGGDETVLDLAIKTGRMPCITYAGQDDFYRNETIAHMVNLVHLDAEKAAILDNNRPGQFVWMARKQLLDRWRGVDANGRPLMIRAGVRMVQVGGGWCVIFLDSPPPPYGTKPSDLAKLLQSDDPEKGPRMSTLTTSVPPDTATIAGSGGTEVVSRSELVNHLTQPTVMFGQCSGGRCPTTQPPSDGEYLWLNGYGWAKVVTPALEAKQVEAKADPVKVEPKPDEPKPEEPKPEEPKNNFGVELNKLTPGKWFHNGAETTREQALAAVAGDALADDSERWFLTCVGTPTEQGGFTTAVNRLSPELRDKLHVRTYSPADWQVTQFALPTGVSLRKSAVGRVGAEAGRFAGELTPDTLKRFVADGFNPPKPMPPAPTPVPDQQPQPAPEPASPANPFGLPTWALAALAAALTYFFTRRKS